MIRNATVTITMSADEYQKLVELSKDNEAFKVATYEHILDNLYHIVLHAAKRADTSAGLAAAVVGMVKEDMYRS